MKTARVYRDPLTRKDLEGDATIIAEWGEPNKDGLQQCTIRFDNADNMVVRNVHIDDMKEQVRED